MILILLITLTLCREYRQYTYQEIIDLLNKAHDDHPDIVKLHYATNQLSNPRSLDCGGTQCQFIYAEVAFVEDPTLVTSLIVGGFHGDEVLGPNIVIELLLYILSADLSKMSFLKDRRILLYPMVNPYGYHHNVREEDGIDINRDFPYDTQTCFHSLAARALASIYDKYLIQSGITFHGGDNSVSYPWGSMNHLNGRQGTESPDNSVFTAFAQIMTETAKGNPELGIVEYTFGKMTDAVYPIGGSYEDWAYASSWDETGPTCQTKKSKYARNLIYLIEADQFKQPLSNTYGDSESLEEVLQVWPPSTYPSRYGHINRNIIISLTLIDLSKPYIILKGNSIAFGGCINVDSIKLDNNTYLNKPAGIWNRNYNAIQLNISNQTIEIEYSCDLNLIKAQIAPDPNISQQSYFAQSRLSDTYSVTNGIHQIQSTTRIRQKLFIPPYNSNEEPSQGTPKVSYIYYILVVFCLISMILSVVFYKYCQYKDTDEVMEMVTVGNIDNVVSNQD